MRKITDLKQALLSFLSTELASIGFRKSYQSFYRKIPIGRQILHVAFIKYKYKAESKASVEIRHDELEKLYNIILGELPNTPTATIGAEFGELLGSKSSMVWLINDTSDVPVVGTSILTAFRNVGLPFLESYASLEKIFEILDANEFPRQSFCPIPHVRAEKAIIASYLLGQHKDYDELVTAKLGYLMSINNPYINEFMDFTNKLKEKIKTI